MSEYTLPLAAELLAQVAEIEAKQLAEFDAAVLAFTQVIGAEMAKHLLAAASLGSRQAMWHFDLPTQIAEPQSVARTAARHAQRVYEERGYTLTYDIVRGDKLMVRVTF